MMDTLKAKTEIQMRGIDSLYTFCPHCGKELIQTFQPTQNYDDSNHVRMCEKCDIAWIWRYDDRMRTP